MYFIDKETELTTEYINKYIDYFTFNAKKRMSENKKYYDGKNLKINDRHFEDITKPNNKIATPYSEYIVNLISGYFMGKPVTYDTQNENLKELLSSYITTEIAHNQSIAKDCSIYGMGAELIYINEDKKLVFEKINPTTIIPIYSNAISKELLYCIRFWETKDILSLDTTISIEVYTPTEVNYYTKDTTGTNLISTEPNYLKKVPIVIYYNNEDSTGDSEKVHSLIDGYDLALSDTANYREELNDSYLVFKNTNLDDDSILKMKQNRIIAIEDTEQGMISEVKWMNKDSNDTEQENYKNRLAEDIKRFSCISELENKSHTSATAAKLSMMSLEQVCTAKELYFRKGLLERWQIICDYYNLLGLNITLNDLKITFVRNIPIDISVISDSISKLAPYISKRTLLTQMPFINDIDRELEAINNETSLDMYSGVL